MDKNGELYYKIALSLVPKIGPVLARRLISYTGSAEAIFKQSKSELLKIPNVGQHLVTALHDHRIFHRVDQELTFIERYGIRPLFYLDNDYYQKSGGIFKESQHYENMFKHKTHG